MRKSEALWLYLNVFCGLSAAAFIELYDKFPTAAEAIGDPDTLALLPKERQEELSSDRWIDALAPTAAYMREKNISFVLRSSEEYPESLRSIEFSPAILYYIGDLSLAKSKILAIIGTRRPDRYGRETTECFASAAAACGITVVSGMADGLDGLALRKALEVGGKGIAVLTGGVDHVYPSSNRDLYEALSAEGLILSELPPKRQPHKSDFPFRNRLISGLSDGVLITEAPLASGTMITAEYACAQGRTVMAVPGDITREECRGTNRLIRDGAMPATEPDDVLQQFGFTMVSSAPSDKTALLDGLEGLEKKIARELLKAPCTAEELSARLSENVDETLGLMEISGLITKEPGKIYVINK